MALFDEIQDRLRKQAAGLSGAAPAVGTQAALTATAQAGTGRDTGGSAPRASNVGEQVQAAAGAAQSSQLASRLGAAADRLSQQQQSIRAATEAGTAKLAAGQSMFDTSQAAGANAKAIQRQAATNSLATSLAGQESRGIQSATQGYQTKAAAQTADAQAAQDDVFDQFKQGSQELAYRKDSAQLEQVAQTLALGDKEYMDQIQQVGTLRRLDDANAWQDEMQRLTLGDKLDAALKSAKFQVDLNADQRTLNEQMSSIDYDTALLVLNSEIQGKNTATVFKGVTDLANTGAKAYVKDDQSDPSAYPATSLTSSGASTPGGSP